MKTNLQKICILLIALILNIEGVVCHMATEEADLPLRAQKKFHNRIRKAISLTNYENEGDDETENSDDETAMPSRKVSVVDRTAKHGAPTTMMVNKPTQPTQSSLKPTVQVETTIPMTATKFSGNMTRTPSTKPTAEAPSTPLPNNYEDASSGSGNGSENTKQNKRVHNRVRQSTPTTRLMQETVTRMTTISKEPKVTLSGYDPTRGLSTTHKSATKVDDEDEEVTEDNRKTVKGNNRARAKATKVFRTKLKKTNSSSKNEESDENEDIMEENKRENMEENPQEPVDDKGEKDTEKRVLCVGDSITEGYYENGVAFHPYSRRLSALLNAEKNSNTYNVYNEGVSGECVFNEMTKRMPVILQKYKPLDLVIILGGTNDLNQMNCSKENLFDNIKQLHDMAHKIGAKSVAITIPDADISQMPLRKARESMWQEVNDRIRAYAQKHDNVILCDLAEELPYRTLDEDQRRLYWDDNLHYTPEGYDKMAEIIYDSIQGEF